MTLRKRCDAKRRPRPALSGTDVEVCAEEVRRQGCQSRGVLHLKQQRLDRRNTSGDKCHLLALV